MGNKKVFLGKIGKSTINEGGKHRLDNCPFPSSCYPCGFHTDRRGAGNCAGLLHKSDNLDCIRECIFWVDLKTKELEHFEHFMTPEEALNQVLALSDTIRGALASNSEYRRHEQILNRRRRNGDKNPSQY